MTDANYVEYANDALRVPDSVGDMIEMGADNGEVLGALIAVGLIFVFIIIILLLVLKFGGSFLSFLQGK